MFSKKSITPTPPNQLRSISQKPIVFCTFKKMTALSKKQSD
jgi:hypothetical protein